MSGAAGYLAGLTVEGELMAQDEQTPGSDWQQVPEGTMLTHEQALARFLTWSFDEQLRYMTHLRDMCEAADRCIMHGHEAAVLGLAQVQQQNANLRDTIDRLLRGDNLSTGVDSGVEIAGVYMTTEQVQQVRQQARDEAIAEYRGRLQGVVNDVIAANESTP